jgi:hypothetical protein
MLWIVWESVILNKRILILGTNPYQVSQAVLASISLINPLLYCGQFSPYVTVFDTSLKHYQNESENYIIGATNPLFCKLFNANDIVLVDITGKRAQLSR